MRKSRYNKAAPPGNFKQDLAASQGWIISRLSAAGLAPSTQVVALQLLNLMWDTKSKSKSQGFKGFWCHPTQRWIGTALSRSRQRVNLHIRYLAERNIVKKLRVGKRRANIYQFGAWLRRQLYIWVKYIRGGFSKPPSFRSHDDVTFSRLPYDTYGKSYNDGDRPEPPSIKLRDGFRWELHNGEWYEVLVVA